MKSLQTHHTPAAQHYSRLYIYSYTCPFVSFLFAELSLDTGLFSIHNSSSQHLCCTMRNVHAQPQKYDLRTSRSNFYNLSYNVTYFENTLVLQLPQDEFETTNSSSPASCPALHCHSLVWWLCSGWRDTLTRCGNPDGRDLVPWEICKCFNKGRRE